MPKTQPREQPKDKDMEQHKRETLIALVGEQVLHALGEPAGLQKVHVRWLWEDHYRVNILIGKDAVTSKIANSYFVQADGDGKIVEASPKITKPF